MKNRIINNPIFKFFLIATVFLFLNLPVKSYSAIIATSAVEPKDRIRECTPNPDRSTTIEGISDMLGPDVNIELTNLYCASGILVEYGAFKATQWAVNAGCKTTQPVTVSPSLYLDGKRMIQAVKNIKEPACAAAYASAATALTAVTAHAATVQAISAAVFPRVKVCGSDWQKYDTKSLQKTFPGASQERISWMDNNNKPDELGLIAGKAKYEDHQPYREWLNGGIEKEYPGCRDPNRENSPPQRYYFRGYQPAVYNCEKYNIRDSSVIKDPLKGIKMTDARRTEYREAYECCVNISRNNICIEYDSSEVVNPNVVTDAAGINKNLVSYNPDGSPTKSKSILCEATPKGVDITKLCTIDGVQFTAQFVSNKSMICASTYSLCPFNFNIGGGNLECDAYTDSPKITSKDIKNKDCAGKGSEVRNNDCSPNGLAGKCKNYCQPLEHCVIVEQTNYNYNTSIGSPYFSDACLNFVGDSKNLKGYGLGTFDLGTQNHFSAPIAQCVKETVENVFFNRAGHTKCKNGGEIPNNEGDCNTPNYVYKKGEFVTGTTSFFEKLQSNLRTIVQLVLILSVMFTGFKVLAGNQDALKRKELISYIIKIAVIMYFVTGQAWQTVFFNGIYTASESVSTIIFKVTTPSDPEKRDGCQFGEIKDEAGNIVTSDPYPKGKSYLAIWDTMDCKIAYYLGMGMNADFGSFVTLIAASFISGAIGIAFAVLLLIFGITLILATISMLHVFLTTAITIIILVYVSIIIIPLILFKKTEDIFNKWLTNLISLSIQPIILFAYMGIFIAVFDFVMIGSATFTGDAPTARVINCQDKCFDSSGKSKDIKLCDPSQDQEVRPTRDSVACIVNTKNNVVNWPGLELFNISIPILKNLFSAEGIETIGAQVKTMLKGALLLIILYSFIAQIPETAQALMGGVSMRMSTMSVKDTMKKLYGGLNAAATRGRRATKSVASKVKAEVGRGGAKSKSTKSDD